MHINSEFFGIGLLQKSRQNICFEAIQNDGKSEYTRLEQSSIFKFLVDEKGKPYEIDRICDVHEEACFNQKNVYKWTKHGLTPGAWIEKTVHEVETHWLSLKEMFWAQQ